MLFIKVNRQYKVISIIDTTISVSGSYCRVKVTLFFVLERRQNEFNFVYVGMSLIFFVCYTVILNNILSSLCNTH